MPQKKGSREKKLQELGWIKQNTIGEPRLTECVELYKLLGYEIRLEPVIPSELDGECRKCYELEENMDTVRTIYTRRKKERIASAVGHEHDCQSNVRRGRS